MDIGQALTNGCKVLRKNPKIFVPAFILAILSTYMQTLAIPEFETIDQIMSWFSWYLPLIILFGLINVFLSGMIIKMTYDASRRRMSLGKAAKFVLSKYIILLLSSIVFGILAVFGFIALIIPGIFITIKLLFFSCAVLIDNKGIVSSLEKSWGITKGNWWNVFALALILGIISFIFGFFAGISTLISQTVYLVLYFLIVLLVTPWVSSSYVFAYLQLRRRKS